jgi:hypothetical protein
VEVVTYEAGSGVKIQLDPDEIDRFTKLGEDGTLYLYLNAYKARELYRELGRIGFLRT